MSIILKILIMVSLAEYQNNKHWEREWEQAEKEALEAERLEAQAAEEE